MSKEGLTPEEHRLAQALATWQGLEAARERRALLGTLTALLSVPVGALVFWPTCLSEVGHRAVLTCWGMSLTGLGAALVSELRLAMRAVRHRAT